MTEKIFVKERMEMKKKKNYHKKSYMMALQSVFHVYVCKYVVLIFFILHLK